MTTTAQAHPNIALVKYWGKQDKPGNLPATPNLSITLSELVTTTVVDDAEQDQVALNGAPVDDAKINGFLARMREAFDIPPLQIDSHNNFPTGAGLASSASGFAALVTAINQHCGLSLDTETLSDWARQGSASAARSMFGGFVALVPPQWRAQPVAPSEHWPLHVVVAITSHAAKSVSSTEGMRRSADTSPFYDSWVRTSSDDYANASRAIAEKDFAQLAAVAELSCLKMQSVMLTSFPTLTYWNPASVACMDAVRQLRSDGVPVFFTNDAGPQIKAVCLPEAASQVAATLGSIEGVREVTQCALGNGARVIDP